MKIRLSLLVLVILLVSLIPLSAYGDRSIPDERLLPRLVDNAFLLSDDEVAKLTSKLDAISERQNLDVVVITVDSLEGHTPTGFADDVYDYNGFGMGQNRDGILLLLSMEERDWAISTHGYGITAFTDAGQKHMTDIFLGDISKGKYYQGFEKFADLADDFISQARSGAPYDVKNLPKKPMSPIWILISIVGGVLVGFISTGSMKSSLKSVSKQRVASKYLVDTSMAAFANNDLFLYSTVTKTEKKKESESSGGGSSTHTSSSGSTHGGSSGKF